MLPSGALARRSQRGGAVAASDAVPQPRRARSRSGSVGSGRRVRAQGLALLQRLVGRDHPRVGQDLGALAAILHGQDRFAAAERLYRRALAIFEKTLGPDHYEVGFVLGNLAVACHERGKLAEAAELYRRCLQIMDRTVGPSNPQTALFRAHFGGFYAEQGSGEALARCWRAPCGY
ncbi:tetratricopeptide repeat protein [Nannocystis pusilla]|uniref:tetratricopeptide repeat protein n=1 Tax=Nannocystis pusilla TaxID=889268 RepID=UPI003B81F1FB